MWNQAVMRTVGHGPKPPNEGDDNGKARKHITPEDAKAYATHAKQRMRITQGYRTGIIAGGPQGEEPMRRAAATVGSFAAAAMAGGCRGCHARR